MSLQSLFVIIKTYGFCSCLVIVSIMASKEGFVAICGIQIANLFGWCLGWEVEAIKHLPLEDC